MHHFQGARNEFCIKLFSIFEIFGSALLFEGTEEKIEIHIYVRLSRFGLLQTHQRPRIIQEDPPDHNMALNHFTIYDFIVLYSHIAS
jgi:hypothetical protein